MLLWSAAVTNRGVDGSAQRFVVAIPSAITAVSRTTDTTPVERIRYQTAVEPLCIRILPTALPVGCCSPWVA